MSYTDQDFETTAASHTPGPWEPTESLDLPGQTPHAPTLDGWIGVWCSDEANGDVVAYCHPANARLIAAAPDLLAALERFGEAMKRGRYPELQGVACDAFQAIAKATGREP